MMPVASKLIFKAHSEALEVVLERRKELLKTLFPPFKESKVYGFNNYSYSDLYGHFNFHRPAYGYIFTA